MYNLNSHCVYKSLLNRVHYVVTWVTWVRGLRGCVGCVGAWVTWVQLLGGLRGLRGLNHSDILPRLSILIISKIFDSQKYTSMS